MQYDWHCGIGADDVSVQSMCAKTDQIRTRGARCRSFPFPHPHHSKFSSPYIPGVYGNRSRNCLPNGIRIKGQRVFFPPVSHPYPCMFQIRQIPGKCANRTRNCLPNLVFWNLGQGYSTIPPHPYHCMFLEPINALFPGPSPEIPCPTDINEPGTESCHSPRYQRSKPRNGLLASFATEWGTRP